MTSSYLARHCVYKISCCCSIAKSCPTFCNPMDHSMPGFPILHYLPQFSQTHVHWGSDAIQVSHPLSSLSPFLNLSQIRIVSKESALPIRWPKYWSFSFSINPFNECSGLMSFWTDWFDLLAVQGTLKSLLQYHSSNASIFWCLAFLMAQLSHPYLKFIFCKNTKISTNCWTTVDRRMLEPTKKKIPYI